MTDGPNSCGVTTSGKEAIVKQPARNLFPNGFGSGRLLEYRVNLPKRPGLSEECQPRMSESAGARRQHEAVAARRAQFRIFRRRSVLSARWLRLLSVGAERKAPGTSLKHFASTTRSACSSAPNWTNARLRERYLPCVQIAVKKPTLDGDAYNKVNGILCFRARPSAVAPNIKGGMGI